MNQKHNIVYDNIIFSLQRYGGISVVWANLLQRVFNNNDFNIHILEYEGAAKYNISRKNLNFSPAILKTLSHTLLIIKRYINPKSSIVDFNISNDKFIFHSSYYRTCSCTNAINITTVHDFTYEFFVNNPFIRFFHCYQKHKAIRVAQHIVCISENTRNDLLKLLPDINPDKVSVIYNGVDKRFNYCPEIETEDFILFVGNRDGYKNFMAIISPLKDCHRTLKIVGKPLTKKELAVLEKSKIKYSYCGIVSDEELNNLYNRAFCLIYPSKYEGFGLPIIEAQMAGCPVIAYNASSIPEVIGDKRLLVDDFTIESIKQKIKLLENKDVRLSIIKRGLKNASRFTWDAMTEQYCNLYKRLIDK